MNDMIQGSKYPAQEATIGRARRIDITLRQNIDEQIKQAEARVKELQETKARMEATGILDARIDDLQRSMAW